MFDLSVFAYLDRHSGAIVAISAVGLAFITGVYVFLTYRLVREQSAGVKREIVEKIYQPLSDAMGSILDTNPPNDLNNWVQLKSDQPFLAYHHLIRDSLRRSLDDVSKRIDSSASGEFEAVRQDAGRVAAHLIQWPLAEQTHLISVEFVFPDWTRFESIELLFRSDVLAPSASAGSVVAIEITTERPDGGQDGSNGPEIPAAAFAEFVARLRAAVETDAEGKKSLELYRGFLAEIRRIRGQIEGESFESSMQAK
jgi:hypothetical protein